jgi:glycolate oxidase iron-sulfur subunit
MQPEIAKSLRERKVGNIESVRPDVVAAGNIGCITQLAPGMRIPIVHTVELLDWAYGGPVPRGLEDLEAHVKDVPDPRPLLVTT